MASFVEKLRSREGHLVYLSQGTHEGKPTWHYVKVEKQKLPMFEKALKQKTIDVADYGEVLFSGWGKEPPESITQKVIAMFEGN